ncbi:hypothetical protein ACK8OR_09645 [Jannaschia sp. KMU-145]|uniref:hypothetical protein n=1 Tax=Jannaschia halovivens TaxID=3388667 RepID=UPI00396AF127
MKPLLATLSAFLVVTSAAFPQVVIDEGIEPSGWSEGPRPVALRCAGLLGIIAKQASSMEALNAQMILLREAVRLSDGDPPFGDVAAESEEYAEAYLGLPQTDETGAMIASDMQSCTTLISVVQKASE